MQEGQANILVGPVSNACGYLRVGNEDFALHFRANEVLGSPRLCEALQGHEHQLQLCSPDQRALLAEVLDVVERQPVTAKEETLPQASFYELLVQEFDSIGWADLLSISPCLKTVELQLEDVAGREHIITITLPSDYPKSAPSTRTALPAQFEVTWPLDVTSGKAVYSLNQLITQFKLELDKYQALWDVLDDLDTNTWVRFRKDVDFA